MKNSGNLLVLLLTVAFQSQLLPVSSSTWGGLYPRESVNREVRNLDGFWDFRLAPLQYPNLGFDEEWFKQPLRLTGSTIKMAVPSSYNDVTQDKAIRDHIGWAWYDRTFHIPKRWIDDEQRIMIRAGSAHYYSILYVNGVAVAEHEGGHLPFTADITSNVNYDQANLITICINNTLTPLTLPQGNIVYETDLTRYPPGYFVQTYEFDFFNYAGLHRPVLIYTTPKTYIDDINVVTETDGTSGSINYNVTINSTTGSAEGAICSVNVFDADGALVTNAIGCEGQITLANANLWWPYLMSDNPGYLYTLMFSVSDVDGVTDVYPQKVGIRQIGWNSTTVTINNEPLYLKGCGKHEDSDIRGKGLDYALIVKDFSLLKWLGANSFRTSHYPYSEEIMDMADQEGIMIIDESPAVVLTGFGPELLDRHRAVMTELVRRDKNRPSVILWSVGNEPKSYEALAGAYFKDIADYTRSLDSTRPVTCVLNAQLSDDLAAPSMDLLLINRYYGWYSDTGHLEVITRQIVTEYTSWHVAYDKPVMISEYGAGTFPGIHIDPSYTWSEEYQVGYMQEHFKAFDDLKKLGFFFGEHIWNFADFLTPQSTGRPAGNHKGVFTRQRQPKMSAFVLRDRYLQLETPKKSESSLRFLNKIILD